MTKPRCVLALAIVLGLLFAQRAFAQDMTFNLNQTEQGGGHKAKSKKAKSKKGSQEGQQAQGQAQGQPQAQGQAAQQSQSQSGSADVIGQLAGEGEQGLEENYKNRKRATETKEEIYAIQRIYALRINRFELAPSVAFNINDPFVSHPGIGLALNYWFTNVLAVGVNFLWYQGLGNASSNETGSDLNFFVQQAASLGVPVNEWQLGANLNFEYVPIYGKFSMFRKFIFQWDSYIVGGLGIMRTRPIPVVDKNRSFDFGTRVAFNAGLGLRIFLTRFLSVFGELRDYLFLDKYENLQVDLVNPNDKSTWLQSGSTLTQNVSIQVGVTIFFPFTFQYKLPK